jgi:hypothetical protein
MDLLPERFGVYLMSVRRPFPRQLVKGKV